MQHLPKPINMIKLYIIILSILLPSITFSQQLTIDETLEYISEQHSENNAYKIVNNRLNERKYTLDKEGFLTITSFADKKIIGTATAHVDDLKKAIRFKKGYSNSTIYIDCAFQNCFSCNGARKWYETEYDIVITQEYQARKIYTALTYLFSLFDQIDFKRDIDDPFATTNNNVTISDSSKSEKIKLTEQNGTFGINVNFGDITESFVLDTGASETTITNTLEKELIANGLITKSDYLPDGLYKIADGSIITQRRILLKELSVNQYSVKKIVVSVGNVNSPLLLGKNFLDKFKSWSIDNNEKTLKLSI